MSLLPALLPVTIAVIALLLTGVVGVIASRSTDPVRHVRGRLWLALGAFGAALVASWFWGLGQPALLGLPIVVGPGAAATVGVLVFTLLPAHVPGRSGRRRGASLRARSVTQVVGGRTLVLPSALLVALVAILVTTGVTADRTGDAVGRGFSIVTPEMGAAGGPYPGWFYGGPILITAAILVLSVAVAVRRTVLLPAVSSDDMLDEAWRAAVGRTLIAIATAGVLLYLAGVLWAAGVVWKILEQTGTTGLEPMAIAQGALAQAAGLAAVVLLVLAAVRVAGVGRAARRHPVAS